MIWRWNRQSVTVITRQANRLGARVGCVNLMGMAAIGLGIGLLIPGCGATPGRALPGDTGIVQPYRFDTPQTVPPPGDARTSNQTNAQDDAGPMTPAEMIARQQQAMARTGQQTPPAATNQQPVANPPQVHWLDQPAQPRSAANIRPQPGHADTHTQAQGAGDQQAGTSLSQTLAAIRDRIGTAQADDPAADGAQPQIGDGATGTGTATGPAKIVRQPMTEKQLVQKLLDQLSDSSRSPTGKAMLAAALSALSGDAQVDSRLLADLSPNERLDVRRFAVAFASLVSAADKGEASPLKRERISKVLESLAGPEPMQITAMALCSKVSGFGVYEPFDSTNFLAGRDQRMIVYTELDNFTSTVGVGNVYEVRLSQQVVLHNEADGLAVWKQDPVRIVDRSRNKRRDFFTVQMITLPARLGVGKYLLKVTITDQQGSSVDEKTMPIRIVADRSLVKSDDEKPVPTDALRLSPLERAWLSRRHADR